MIKIKTKIYIPLYVALYRIQRRDGHIIHLQQPYIESGKDISYDNFYFIKKPLKKIKNF